MLATIKKNLVSIVNYLKKNNMSDPKVRRLVKKYRPSRISESLPNTNYTSYSVNKGEKLVFCIRSKKTHKLIDINTMMFVAIHELAHVMTKSVEVDAIALGLKGRYPEKLLKEGEKTQLIIRNQPYGEVDLKSVDFLTRKVAVPQPDGTVKALPDPREKELFSRNVLLTLEGKGRVTDDGPILGNIKVKIGRAHV